MDLREYLHRTKKTATRFAKEVGCHRNTVSMAKNGLTCPGRKFAKKVEELTNGQVTYQDLMKTYYDRHS